MSDYIRRFRRHSFQQRYDESKRMRTKYPDRCCVVVGRVDNSPIPDIDRHKFLVPRDLSVGQFMYVVRQRIRLRPEQSIFMFAGNSIPPVGATISTIYHEYADSDGFLYFTYAGENTFG
jgi:GABA(A) receptor-associated protein